MSTPEQNEPKQSAPEQSEPKQSEPKQSAPKQSEPLVTVRPAEPADADLISALIHELAAYERQPEDCHATPARVREQLFGHSFADAECLIGERDKEPVGFALFFHTFSTWECAPGLFLEDLFVQPEHRGKGVGKALFVRLAELAVARGCQRFEFSVLDWNTPSIDFYRVHGARPMDDWTVHRIDGVALTSLAEQGLPGND